MEIDARGSEKSLSFCCLKIDNIFCVSRLTREGSGSTLIAADQTGRVCYGIELDEKFVDVIVKRYIEVTGDTEVTVQRNHEVLTYNQVLKELEEQV